MVVCICAICGRLYMCCKLSCIHVLYVVVYICVVSGGIYICVVSGRVYVCCK